MSDQAKLTAPSVGPMALKAEDKAMPRPLTRPRAATGHESLMRRKTAVKHVEVRPCAAALCSSSAGSSAAGPTSGSRGGAA